MPSNLTPRINYLEDGTTGPLSFRNKIINGNFDIWQRGTSQSVGGGGQEYGSDDRWRNENNGSTKVHSRQSFTLGQTDVPGNPTYFSRTVVTSVAGAGNYTLKSQRIEGVRTLAGQTATISFWAKADAAKNMAVEFYQYFGTGGSPSSQVNSIGVTTCALTTSWKKFTVTVAVPSISGKVIGTNNDDAFTLMFWLEAGSTFNARTNSLGQQSGTFDIAQVQLEAGSQATAFEQRPIGTELGLCQRYFWRQDWKVSTDNLIGLALGNSATNAYVSRNHPVAMRTAPTLSGSFVIVNLASTVIEPNTAISQTLCDSVSWASIITVSANLTAGTMYRWLLNNTGQFIAASAEL